MSQKTTTRKKRPLGTGMPAVLADRLSSVMSIFVFCMFVVQPLIIGPQRYVDYTGFKLRSYLIMLAFALFLLACVFLQYVYTQPSWVTKTWKQRLQDMQIYEYALIAYLVFLTISMLIAVLGRGGYYAYNALWGSTGDRNEGFFVLFSYIIVIWSIGRLYRPKQWHLMALCIVAAILCCYGILQFYMIDPLRLNFANFNMLYTLSSVATISNRDFASTFLCLSIFICVVQFTQQNSKLRWVFFACLLPIVYTLTLMKTLSGIVGIAATAILLFPYFIRNRKYAYRFFFQVGICLLVIWLAEFFIAQARKIDFAIFNIMMIAAIACLVLSALFYVLRSIRSVPHPSVKAMHIIWPAVLVGIVIIFILALPKLGANPVGGRSSLLFNQLYEMVYHGNFDDSFGSERLYVWKRGLMMIQERPLFGQGPDGFAVEFYNRFYQESLDKYGVYYDKVHNEYLQTWTDLGIFALISWLTFAFSLLWKAHKKFIKEPVVLAVAATMICYMVQAFFNLSMPGVSPSCWAMWGVLVAMTRAKSPLPELDDGLGIVEYEYVNEE